MLQRMILAIGATVLMVATAHADPIEGKFRTPKTGATAAVAACGTRFCMTYTSGQFKGKQFATFTPTGGGKYTGTITDYTSGGKKYTGKAEMVGKNIKISGCVMGGMVCKGEVFQRL